MILFPMLDLDAPGGGVRIIYAMVETLQRAGIPAAVWHGREGTSSRWFEHDANVVFGLERTLEEGDLLVMPELGGARYRRLVGDARVVILNQGHFHTLADAAWELTDDSDYPGWPNAVAAIATSQAIERFLRALVGPGFPLFPVPVFVDEEMFRDEPKERLIVMTLNRRQEDLAAVAALIRRAGLPRGWTLLGLEGLTSAQVADTLGRAAVMVSLAERDGFGLPGAEAMAAGCHVVGFHGDGGREYLRPEHSTPVEEGDLVGLAEAVVAAAWEFESHRAAFDSRASAGREFVRAHYSRERFDHATVAAFRRILELGVAGQPHPCTVRHYSSEYERSTRTKTRGAVRRGVLGLIGATRPERVVPEPTRSAVPPAPPPEAGLSIVIPHWGDPDLALGVVEDVSSAVLHRPCEVVVVDDASPRPFPDIDGVKVVRRTENGGFGAAVNSGAAVARHPWLWVVNSDVRFAPDLPERLVRAAAALYPAVCSPQLMEHGQPVPTGNTFHAVRPTAHWAGLQVFARYREAGLLDEHMGIDHHCRPGRRARTEWLVGACLLFPRALFEEVGGFDERFHMFSEEVDLQYRLAERGVSAWFLGDLTVEHQGGGSTVEGTRVPELLRARLGYARKHGFYRRMIASMTAVDAANLGYNLVRDATGKHVHAWESWRRSRQVLRDARRSSAEDFARTGGGER